MKTFVFRYEKEFAKKFEIELLNKYKNIKQITTNYSMTYEIPKQDIKHGYKFLFNNEYLGFGALSIIRNTKIDIRSNLKNNKFKISDVRPRYYGINQKYFSNGEGNYNPVMEIDINSAYLESAYYQNIISEKVYLKLKTVSKKMRLRALGSIATKKTVCEYENGKIINTYIDQDKELAVVWKMISKGCEELIYSLLTNLQNQYLFHWFDNLFIEGYADIKDVLYKTKFPERLTYQRNLYNLSISINKKKRFVLPI